MTGLIKWPDQKGPIFEPAMQFGLMTPDADPSTARLRDKEPSMVDFTFFGGCVGRWGAMSCVLGLPIIAVGID